MTKRKISGVYNTKYVIINILIVLYILQEYIAKYYFSNIEVVDITI